MSKIPVFRPLIQHDELAAATASLEQGWLGMGASVGEFEQLLGGVIGGGDRHVVAVNTGHSALHLALMLCGVGPGDEVITPSFNNIADFQAILAVGATPVFCDILADTLCIDLDKAESLVGPRTKAIIVMDYGCFLADHARAAELASRHNLRVIHDAAHSIGSSYRGKPVGSFSDICMFSFDPVKTITCIDGGALVVRTKEEVSALHEMRLIGMGQPASVMYGNQRAWTYDVKRLGFRYHMANLHAAIGIAQLTKLDRIGESRRESCRLYNERLAAIKGLATPATDFSEVVPFLYYVRAPGERRDELREALKDRGVDTGIHWQPGHAFSLFSEFQRGDLSVTEQVGKEIFTLPLHSMMESDTVETVCEALAQACTGLAR